MPPKSRPGLHLRMFRALLRLFPAEFRGDFGADMEADFADQHRDIAVKGRRAAAALWLRTLPGLVVQAMAEHARDFVTDARYGLRMMARSRGFTTAALLMIALGTGANAAMYSVIDAVMLRSPFTDPDRIAIVRIEGTDPLLTAAISLAQFDALHRRPGPFEAVAALDLGAPILVGSGAPRRLRTECVTADMFPVLGTKPVAGRTFLAADDHASAPETIVVSFDFWQRVLGGDPEVLGRVLTLDGTPTTVIGIMPHGFAGPNSRNEVDGWLPLGPALEGQDSAGCPVPRTSVNVFARVKRTVRFDDAARLATDAAEIPRVPDWQGRTGGRLSLLSMADQTLDDVRGPLEALLGAVVFVLLIASANVANLQLERVFARRRELAVRMAIGATRGRVIRQTLTENLMLYIAGCACGLLAARWTLQLIVGLLPPAVPHLHDIHLNAAVLTATIVVACVAGLAVGLIPARQATSLSLIDDLRVSAPTATPGGLIIRRALVIAQIALSVTLVVGAALMIRTFLTLRPAHPGFDATGKLIALVRLQGEAAKASAPVYARVLQRIEAIPGVQSVTGSTYIPMSGTVRQTIATTGDVRTTVWTGTVMPGYFEQMHIAVIRGRAFTPRDDESSAPVAIVNDAFVRRSGLPDDPLQHTVAVQLSPRGPRVLRQIVGVIADTRSLGGTLNSHAELYVPFAQDPGPVLNLIVRAANPWDSKLPMAIRAALAQVDPTQVIDRFLPFQDLLDMTVSSSRSGAWLLGIFAAIAALLAAVGLAAAIAWWISQRTREIGIRMALGADASRVTHSVVTQGVMTAATGVVLGLIGAGASTRLLKDWLYGVTALDRATFAGCAAGMLLIALVASYLPSRRAARVDPLVALRTE